MHDRSYTFVTVVYEKEYEFLALQARSMRKYCPRALVFAIIVIDNGRKPLRPSLRDRLLAEYGDLAERVRFVRATEISANLVRSGWWNQQVLKLLVARLVQSERYVILDAKNHLVFDLKADFLESKDGRAAIEYQDWNNRV